MATVAETSSRLIRLADEPDFTLGAISVEPAYRQVRWGDQARTVEPRVMQVLVALGREPGVIVSRETLARRCWHGRIVGENALQRVISLLRQLATESDAFRIETITKVGYRLLVTAQAALAPEKPAQIAGLRSRRAVLAGAAGLIGAGVGALWLRPLSPRRRTALRLQSAGIETQRRGGQANLRQAIRYLEDAVQTDPQDADGWSHLARARLDLLETVSEQEFSEQVEAVKSAARRALALKRDHQEAAVSLAITEPLYRNWLPSHHAARAASARFPDDVRLRERTARLDAEVGRLEASLVGYRWLAEREPFAPRYVMQLAHTLCSLGRPAEADPLLANADRLWPIDPGVWFARYERLLLGGRPADALAMTRGLAVGIGGASPLSPEVAQSVAGALARGREADRELAIAAVVSARATGRVASFIAGPYLAALGALDEAYDVLNAYYLGRRDPVSGRRQPLPRYAWRRTDILFSVHTAPLRADARFQRLLVAIGLDEFWRRSRQQPDFRNV